MWRSIVVIWLFLLLDQCCGESFRNLNVSESCASEPKCLHCIPKGCIKCPELIVYPTRQCVERCPFGHNPKWSTMVDFMGLVCTHNGNPMGLSSAALTVLTGVLCGTILCVFLFAVAVIYIKYRRKNTPQLSDTSSETDDTPERKDFLKRLETLRPYSQDYLDMVNDTRRQLRQLHREGDNSAISAYKPVLRDLARILVLLNKSPDTVGIPDDWEHLFTWAEKTLKRYKRMSESSQPQVAQLISFLQSPITPSEIEEPDYSVRGSTTMSTFKPDQMFGSSLSLSEAAIKTFNYNYDKYQQSALNPQWKFEYSLVGTTSEFNPELWKNSKEYLGPLFLEDDFHMLGFRPQDEITTEL
ncbi:uncharacterized protein LOC132699367 [Cylas formicarius]|uniref:uncharacterized protein LOC132699367 n=1 Tax=Cylas formicarius TaxID=197179 RepID=UPI002958CE73|nr:uncharacterized protein LOC132699367 [Cylas formicarius]XP_060522013.1 uncharacterized protein LOC132699367 [Cylas formicarius]